MRNSLCYWFQIYSCLVLTFTFETSKSFWCQILLRKYIHSGLTLLGEVVSGGGIKYWLVLIKKLPSVTTLFLCWLSFCLVPFSRAVCMPQSSVFTLLPVDIWMEGFNSVLSHCSKNEPHWSCPLSSVAQSVFSVRVKGILRLSSIILDAYFCYEYPFCCCVKTLADTNCSREGFISMGFL